MTNYRLPYTPRKRGRLRSVTIPLVVHCMMRICLRNAPTTSNCANRNDELHGLTEWHAFQTWIQYQPWGTSIYPSDFLYTAEIKVSSLKREQLPIPQAARAYGQFHRDMPRKNRNPTIGNQSDFHLLKATIIGDSLFKPEDFASGECPHRNPLALHRLMHRLQGVTVPGYARLPFRPYCPLNRAKTDLPSTKIRRCSIITNFLCCCTLFVL